MNLSFITRKRLIGLIVGSILLISIPATLLLTRSSQDIRQRASSQETTALAGTATIHGILYVDQNKDSIPQNSETRIENMVVNLRNSSDKSIVNQTQSDENGYFGFINLARNTLYFLEIVPQDDYLGVDSLTKNISFNSSDSIRQDFRFEFANQQNISTLQDFDLDVNGNSYFDKGDVIALYECASAVNNCPYNKADINHDGIKGGSDDINIAVRRYNKIDRKKI